MISPSTRLPAKSFSGIREKQFDRLQKDFRSVPRSLAGKGSGSLFTAQSAKWIGVFLILVSVVLFGYGYSQRYSNKYDLYGDIADDYYLKYLEYRADEAEMNYMAVSNIDTPYLFSGYYDLAQSYGNLKDTAQEQQELYQNKQKALQTTFVTCSLLAVAGCAAGLFLVFRKASD